MLRDEILNYIESQFMGPSRGYPHQLDYIKDYMPYQHLVTGMLFPQESIVDSDHTISQDATVVDSEVDPLSLSFTYLTAVVGMSINIPTHIKKINIKCSASYYELIEIEKEEVSDRKIEKEKYWERNDLDEENIIVELKDHEIMIFNDRAKIDVRVFVSNGNKLVTITIINNAHKEKRGKVKQVDVLSRVAMSCWITGDNILPYPKVFRSTMDGEEEEQQVLYKDEHIYAVGHACSVKWENASEDDVGNIISLDFIPTGITRGSKSTLSEYRDSKAISMEFLANPENKQDIIKEMRAFVEPYKAWIDQTIEKLKSLSDSTNQRDYFEINESHKKAIGGLIDKLKEALTRINIGIDFIEEDPSVLDAFQLANKAMLMQMVHGAHYLQILDSVDDGNFKFFQQNHNHVSEFNNIDYFDLKSLFGQEYRPFEWRPFQLAYFLTTCKSSVIKDDPYRETVDLIWFSTGGGKTEAYLFVSAFLIFYNKIIDPSIDGVEIIMRYTLRLLTQDQFVRSSRFITACEKIRRENIKLLGPHEIGIGLWIGGGTSPNKFTNTEDNPGSKEVLKELYKESNPDCNSPFSIGACPWCNTNLVPEKQSRETSYGFKADDSSFEIFCPSKQCEFHNKLPIQVVDAAIYKNPPTFILGTIDKFIRLAHEVDSGKILVNKDSEHAVSLIIQDELHLISGPLGTVTGSIEAAFDTMLSHWGVKPKYMAATATIRGAANQIQKLYARDVATFPPSGITHADRFFSRIDETDEGRLYVGVMSQGHTAVTTTVRIAAALSQSIEEIPAPSDELDGYHTLVIYHNSRNEKSKTKTLAAQDIPERIKQIASNNNKREIGKSFPREFKENGISELSADVQNELFDTRKKLELKRGDDDAIDILSVTNIIQVGIDIPRLAVMQVTGQPKTSSEFIQATSRVGRGKNKGLVMVNYIATNPRDRSHYEQFKGYISALNRFVEPTSVTPAAEPALKRTLPTCIVMLAKQVLDLGQWSAAGQFNYSNNNLAKELFDKFEERLIKADPSEKANIKKYIHDHLHAWENLITRENRVHYHAKHKAPNDVKFLTKDFGDVKNEALWQILNSMRHVDTEVGITIE
ncbi:helicase-related protein [Gammaproteobacteria bacterium]|nr:helicase-related protein [Gammaproteobacteria bacterium]